MACFKTGDHPKEAAPIEVYFGKGSSFSIELSPMLERGR